MFFKRKRKETKEERPTLYYEEKYWKDCDFYSIRAKTNTEKLGSVLQCILNPNLREIFIDDFTINQDKRTYRDIDFYTGKGYYGEVMQLLLNFAQQHDYHKITGKLVASDLSRREKQIRFYTKWGFTIYEPDKNNDCLIERIL